MNAELTATPAGMKWCAEHKKWEYIRIENDMHVVVAESAPEYKAHIAAIIKMLPGNGGSAVCADCGNPADIVTDGLVTKFYCRHHWDWRSQEQDYLDQMAPELHDPLTEEVRKTFGIEEVKP
jgi:hypothetical protein